MFKNVLVFSPHTDDGELGCGGYISKLVEEGSRVSCIAFSAAERSVPSGFPENILRSEVKQASLELGINLDDLYILNYQVRSFPERRQDILDEMIAFRDSIKPDLVLLPSTNDIHQDHGVITQEGIRAYKGTTMLGYELPWNNFDFRATCFLTLSEDNLIKKLKALKCYESQSQKRYFSEEFIRSLASTRGVQAGCRYAEAFEVIRMFIY